MYYCLQRNINEENGMKIQLELQPDLRGKLTEIIDLSSKTFELTSKLNSI
jgi:hypothetical protein